MSQVPAGGRRLLGTEMASGWPVRPGRAGQSGEISRPTMNEDAWQDLVLDPRGSASAPPFQQQKKNMTKLKTTFKTTPDTHAAANGHWDRVAVSPVGLKSEVSPFDPFSPLSIQFQNGPIAEHGVNGVQLTDVLRICLARYKMLNVSFPCRENSLVITNLQQAIMWDEERATQRTLQGVEGFDKPHASK